MCVQANIQTTKEKEGCVTSRALPSLALGPNAPLTVESVQGSEESDDDDDDDDDLSG